MRLTCGFSHAAKKELKRGPRMHHKNAAAIATEEVVENHKLFLAFSCDVDNNLIFSSARPAK